MIEIDVTSEAERLSIRICVAFTKTQKSYLELSTCSAYGSTPVKENIPTWFTRKQRCPSSVRRPPKSPSSTTIEKEHCRDVRYAHEKASEKSVTAEIRRKAPKEHRRTQGWLRQVAMPGEASGDARLPSAGGDFEDCLFAQTSFGFARPIRSIESSLTHKKSEILSRIISE